MSSTEFRGNVSVSTAKQVFKAGELGREGIFKQAIVDDGLPVRAQEDMPVKSNSEILFGRFPEEFAVKGLVHDAAVNLYSRESEFNTLGIEPSDTEVIDILEGSIEGRSDATQELRSRINQLEKKYGLNPGELTDYRFESGRTVSDLIEDVAEYRGKIWSEETGEFVSIEPEVSVFEDGLSGRIDLLASRGEGGNRLGELKMGEPSRYDEFQVSAYWLMNGDEEAEIVIDYPIEDERLSFDPDQDMNDFDPREYAFDVYRSRDRAVEKIEELRGLQKEYFQTFDSREKATREALKELEVW